MDLALRKLFKKDFKHITREQYHLYDLSFPQYNKKIKISPFKQKLNNKYLKDLSENDLNDYLTINLIKSNPNLRILTLFNDIDEKSIEKIFNNKANIIYSKKINITEKAFFFSYISVIFK